MFACDICLNIGGSQQRPNKLQQKNEMHLFQVTCFLTFNLCNVAGTAAAGFVQWPGDTSADSQVTLLLLALFRLVFAPVFMLCNLAPQDRVNSVVINHDLAFVLIMMAFSLSDGYINNMAMMFGPKAVRPKHQVRKKCKQIFVNKPLQEVTAALLVATAATSITLGSIISNLVVKSL